MNTCFINLFVLRTAKYVLMIFALVLCFANIPGVAEAISSPDVAQITLNGQFDYQAFSDNDGGGAVLVTGPVAGVIVRVYDQEGIGIRYLGQTTTDQSGQFSIVLANDEANGIDPFLTWSASNQWAIVQNGLGQEYELTSNVLAYDLNYSTTLQVSYTIPPVDASAQAFFTLDQVRLAAQFLENAISWSPGTAVYFNTPRPCLGLTDPDVQSCYRLGGIDLKAGDNQSIDVVVHEFGHYVHALKIGELNVIGACAPTFNHSLFDPLAPTCAWTEGWADFFQMAVQNDPDYRGTNLEYVDAKIAAMTDAPEKYEFIVAATLWDIFDTNNETYTGGGGDQIGDGFNGGFSQGLWYVVMELPTTRQPKTLTAFWDEWFALYEYQPEILCNTAYVFDHHEMKRSAEMNFIVVPPITGGSFGPVCHDNVNLGVIGWQVTAGATPLRNYVVSGWQLSTGQSFGAQWQITFELEDDVDVITSLVYSPWSDVFLPLLRYH